jgi:hypothetical protein
VCEMSQYVVVFVVVVAIAIVGRCKSVAAAVVVVDRRSDQIRRGEREGQDLQWSCSTFRVVAAVDVCTACALALHRIQ